MSVDVSRSGNSRITKGSAVGRPRLGGAWSAASVAAGVSFVALWLGVVNHWHAIDVIDGLGPSTNDASRHHHSLALQAWRTYCVVLSPLTFDVLAVVSAVVSVARGVRRDAVCVVLAVVGGQVIVTAVKAATDRPRPGALVGTAASSSFPSDHATSALIGVLVLIVIWAPMLRTRTKLLLVTGASATSVALLGVGRVAVHAHHPSDVVAGYALGTCWATVCLLVTGVVTSSWVFGSHRGRDESLET